LPYYIGLHGQLKYKLAVVFLRKLRYKNFIYNITITDKNERNALLSKDWYLFLRNCKAILGCEGGASLLDETGKIRKLVEHYIELHPQATFRETRNICFKGKDFNINCFTVSPRHFEAAITKTLQILVEGHYEGILKPNIHYIKLNKDFSNINEIFIKLKNYNYCQKIIDRAYRDIVLSKKYSYNKFVQLVILTIKKNTSSLNSNIKDDIIFYFVGYLINVRNKFLFFLYRLLNLLIYIPLKRFNIYSKIDMKKRFFYYKK